MGEESVIMVVSKRQAEGLCEVVHDITTNVYTHLNNMGAEDRDQLWEEIDGSRGLFWQYILPWAREYQNKWESLSDAQRDAVDYLVDIDEYTEKKLKELLAQYTRQVVSIQVIPVIEDISGDVSDVTPQFAGPTAETTQWSVYERDQNGQAHWVADAMNEEIAMGIGSMLQARYSVPIEPQPWKEEKV